MSYPFYHAAGTHRELGRQHGALAGERIAAHLAFLKESLGISSEQFDGRALALKVLFDRHCPHLVEELQGLAEGARISLAEALAVNIRAGLGHEFYQGCTAFVIGPRGTASGEVLIGQNSDIFRPYRDFGYVLALEPQDKPAILMWTFGGMVGYHGLNAAGVAHFANDLGTGGPKPRFGLPHYPIKRLMHECKSLRQVVSLLESLPIHVNANYVLADGSGRILDVEVTPEGLALLEDGGAGFLAHSNHFICRPYACAENDAQTAADSFPRLDRMNELIREKFGRITVDDVKRMLRDHAGHPGSICRHPQSGDMSEGFEPAGETTAALIAEPAHGRLHVAMGNPCENEFVRYELPEKKPSHTTVRTP